MDYEDLYNKSEKSGEYGKAFEAIFSHLLDQSDEGFQRALLALSRLIASKKSKGERLDRISAPLSPAYKWYKATKMYYSSIIGTKYEKKFFQGMIFALDNLGMAKEMNLQELYNKEEYTKILSRVEKLIYNYYLLSMEDSNFYEQSRYLKTAFDDQQEFDDWVFSNVNVDEDLYSALLQENYESYEKAFQYYYGLVQQIFTPDDEERKKIYKRMCSLISGFARGGYSYRVTPSSFLGTKIEEFCTSPPKFDDRLREKSIVNIIKKLGVEKEFGVGVESIFDIEENFEMSLAAVYYFIFYDSPILEVCPALDKMFDTEEEAREWLDNNIRIEDPNSFFAFLE